MAKPELKITEIEVIRKEQEKLNEQQEREALLFGADALLPQKSFDKELEKHQLRNGLEFTLKEVKDLITESAGEYFPMFPNNNPFFKLMYKLCKWDNLNPNDFVKPPCVALYIKQYIYARFPKEILPTLLSKYPSIVPRLVI